MRAGGRERVLLEDGRCTAYEERVDLSKVEQG